MRWPPWSSDSPQGSNSDKKDSISWTNSLNATNWAHYTDPRTLVPTVLLTTTILVSFGLYQSYLRRIPAAGYLKRDGIRGKRLLGTVTRVGDGDNFHLFHTPGGRLAGWGWLRKVPEWKGGQKNTIAIRIAGIDAPESAHFGKAAQPLSAEALEWLRNYVLHRRVRAYVYRHDQYDRIVASVYVRRGLFRKDVGLQMLKAGLATVYEAKTGAEFGELEAKYREAESKAKYGRRGVWSLSKKQFESPRDYKTRTAEQSEAKAQATTSTSSWLPWR